MQVKDTLNNVVFTILMSFVSASAIPEDWTVSAPFQMSSDNRNIVTAMAYLNVTRFHDDTWVWDRREIARFGSGYVGPAKGILVHVTSVKNANDHTGCHLPFFSSKSDAKLPIPGIPWIALIKRGGCSFETKVENAYKEEASGVIVYNDRDSVNLDKMKLSSDNGRNISAVFTFKWKGEEMARYLENDSQVYVEITVGRAEQVRNAALNRTSVLFVSITFIVLMIISLAWLVFYYIQRLRHIHAKDKLSRRLCNAAKKALSKIPTKNIKSEDKEVKDGECCAVCIEPYKTLEVLRILPCTHEFHKNCIDPWLLEHRTCPMCKMDILKHYGFMITDSQESILQVEVDDMGGVTLDSPTLSTELRTEQITPLPQARAEVISIRELSFDGSAEEDNSSRASSPNELTPSLSTSNRNLPPRSEFCANCIAATSAPTNVLVNNQSEKLPDLVNNSDKIDHRSVENNHQSAQVQK